jgi:hypothetical protein
MACAADIVGAAMAERPTGLYVGSGWIGLQRDYNCFPARRSPSAVKLPRPTAGPSCGKQVRIYGVHYATLIEDENPLKSLEDTFLTEQTRQGTKIVTS